VAEPRIRGATRVAAVLGWPVTHSLSPVIHNAAFAALGMDWTYVALPVEPGEVPAAVAGLRALGFAGANVTMPHKEAVADVMDDLTEDADRLRAVNTIEVVRDRLIGHNTDAPGFARFLVHDVGFEPAGKTALLFGAGGAARACALAVARAGLTRIVVALREPARAAPLADALDGFATEVEAIAFDDAAEASADLVVNATPLGAHGEGLPPTAWLKSAFLEAHQRKYGHHDPSAPIEIINVRLSARKGRASTGNGAGASRRSTPAPASSNTRPVWFAADRPTDTMFIDRSALAPGTTLAGPLVVTQFDATTLVPPGSRLSVAESGSLLIEVDA